MPKRKGELPDVDIETLNDMIGALAVEHGCPYGVNSDLVELGEIPPSVHGCNRGVMREGKPWDGVTLYREGQKWRRKLIAFLKRRPDWIAEFRAARELDRRIEALCEAKGLRFAPWEPTPWQVGDGPCPMWGEDSIWGRSWPKAQALRRQLIRELA
jgi:hypothetical protein